MITEKLPDVLLVLAILSGAIGLVSALKLVAAQRAGIRTMVDWLRPTYISGALFVVWVLVR